jgi:hypothetical protein
VPTGGISVCNVTIAAGATTGTVTDKRSMLSRYYNTGIVNVKDFGAKGDGVMDDTEALQTAFDAATNISVERGGARVLIPAGTYVVSSGLIVDLDNIIVEADNSILTYRGNDDNSVSVLSVTKGNHAKISNLFVQCESVAFACINLKTSSAQNMLLENIHTLFGLYGIYYKQNGNGDYSIDFLTLNNCMFTMSKFDGLHLEATQSHTSCPVTISNCIVQTFGKLNYDNPLYYIGYESEQPKGIYIANLLVVNISRLQVDNHQHWQIQCLAHFENCYDLTLTSCNFEDTGNDISGISDGSSVLFSGCDGLSLNNIRVTSLTTDVAVEINSCLHVDLGAIEEGGFTGTRLICIKNNLEETAPFNSVRPLNSLEDLDQLSFTAIRKNDMSLIESCNNKADLYGWEFDNSFIKRGDLSVRSSADQNGTYNDFYDVGLYSRAYVNGARVLVLYQRCNHLYQSLDVLGRFVWFAYDKNGGQLASGSTLTTGTFTNNNGNIFRIDKIQLPQSTQYIQYGWCLAYQGATQISGNLKDGNYFDNTGWAIYAYNPSPTDNNLANDTHTDMSSRQILSYLNNISSLNVSYPTSSYHYQGEIVWNITPTTGGYIGWVCTETGSPGVWKGFGAIQS